MKPIAEIRRTNLDLLAAEAGSQRKMAVRIGKDPKQVNQWFGKGTARNISDATCREIERLWPKAQGWMDTAHGSAGGEESAPAYGAASQPTRQFLEKVRDAEKLLSKTLEIMGADPAWSEDLDLLEDALFILEAETRDFSPAVLLDLSPKLSAKIRNRREKDNGDQRGQAAGTGGEAGKPDSRRRGRG